ncbi:MAG: hypothetical protein JWP94_3205 [Mucilaginibacter sp.]|nr:hypothetical protein [Mucilaginibacter sp.]
MFLTFLFALVNLLTADGQAIPAAIKAISEKITSSVSGYYKKYPSEKIFLHTSQNVYLTGQTIWYKAYLMAYGKPSLLSRIMYIRLSDANGKLITQNMLPVKNSTAYGNINLPDSLPGGWYQLQAFTAWMCNFDKQDFFHQKIYIQNIHTPVNMVTGVTAGNIYHIDFFPEGGDLVDGNMCNIVFKATDENGMPVNVYGDVLDNNNKSVATLETRHDGMGSFELEAAANTNYCVRVHFPDGSVQNISLPGIKKTGLSMRVNAMPASELEVKITYAGQQKEYKDIVVAAAQDNGTVVTYPLKLSRGINVFSFKKDDFSPGIVRLTVFDESFVPLAERVAFIHDKNMLDLSLSKDTLSFDPKSKNIFTLHLADGKNKRVKANVSVAVTDAALEGGPENNIAAYFLMSSELRGYIHQPGYYFKNNSDTIRQQLDLVMQTNGWRHFKWDTVLNDKPRNLKYFIEKEQVVAGKIENYHDKDNLKIKLIVTSADSGKYMGYVEPDSAGMFVLKDYNHRGPATLFYDVVNAKNKKQPVNVTFFNAQIDIASFPPDTISSYTGSKPVIPQSIISDAVKDHDARFPAKGIMLKTVNIREQKLTPTEVLINSHVKHLNADNAYTLDLVHTTFPPVNIMDYIQGRFPGVQIILGPNDSVIKFTYHGTNSIKDKNPLPYFYVDEASSTLDEILNIPLTDVAIIRFAPPPVWFAPLNGGMNGALLIYTRRFGDEKVAGKGIMANYGKYTFNNYSVTREFPLPDYSVTKPTKSPDYRTTLYWNHDLFTDKQGNIKIRFFNSDKAKKYRVVVQAMDANGRLGYLSEEL